VRTRGLGPGPAPLPPVVQDPANPTVLTIDGTDADDVITLALEQYTGPLAVVVPPSLLVTVNGTTTRYAAPLVRITVRGGGGNDSIRVLNELGPINTGTDRDPTDVGPPLRPASPVSLLSVELEGGAGRDALRVPPARPFNTVYSLRGGDGNDLLVGTRGFDTLDGGTGRDRLFGRGGGDTLIRDGGRFFSGDGITLRLDQRGLLSIVGTPGPDTVSVAFRAGSFPGGPPLDVTVNGRVRSFAPPADDSTAPPPPFPVSRLLIDTGAGDDSVTVDPGVGIPSLVAGGAGDDTLSAGGGDDVLWGGPGRDSLRGGAGRDRFFGGAGDDTALDDQETELVRLVEHRQSLIL
jgi:Ca2+-binding RTX toxin-like protein